MYAFPTVGPVRRLPVRFKRDEACGHPAWLGGTPSISSVFLLVHPDAIDDQAIAALGRCRPARSRCSISMDSIGGGLSALGAHTMPYRRPPDPRGWQR